MGIIDENWNYDDNIDDLVTYSCSQFELQLINISENAVKALDCGFVNVIEDKDHFNRNSDEELYLLIETNNDLKQEIASKLKELNSQQTQYESYKQDQKLFNLEVKETHEAFLMARKHYKKCLNIYYSIESRSNGTQTIFVQFFSELKKAGENYSVCLSRNTKTREYILQSTTPTLRNIKELQSKLRETNDVPGLLCCIRQAFLVFKQNKEY